MEWFWCDVEELGKWVRGSGWSQWLHKQLSRSSVWRKHSPEVLFSKPLFHTAFFGLITYILPPRNWELALPSRTILNLRTLHKQFLTWFSGCDKNKTNIYVDCGNQNFGRAVMHHEGSEDCNGTVSHWTQNCKHSASRTNSIQKWEVHAKKFMLGHLQNCDKWNI